MANIIGPKVTANVLFVGDMKINCIVSSSKAQRLRYPSVSPCQHSVSHTRLTYAMTAAPFFLK